MQYVYLLYFADLTRLRADFVLTSPKMATLTPLPPSVLSVLGKPRCRWMPGPTVRPLTPAMPWPPGRRPWSCLATLATVPVMDGLPGLVNGLT